MAYGLPDGLAERQAAEEAEIAELRAELEAEIVELEAEVMAAEETAQLAGTAINPISYVVIGVGVVLVVVAGVLFARRRSTA